MTLMLKDIADFHIKFGLEYQGKPRLLSDELTQFRFERLVSEAEEYRDAAWVVDPEDEAEYTAALGDVLDALVDSVYIALGNVYLHGLSGQFEEAWRRVHQANMAKERAARAELSKFGSSYDIIKPDGWEPPRHDDLVEDNAWSQR